MNAVHPSRVRLVRPERAAGVATPMSETLGAAVPGQPPRSVDLGAYDESLAALYLYSQRRGTDSHVGVVCEVRAEAFADGQVRGHESVRADRVEALAHHFATTPGRSALVALLHRAGPVFARAIAETLRMPPALRFTGRDGVEQTVWRMAGPATAGLCEELGEARHYIADGHHRVAASLDEWRMAGKPPGAGVLCVIYPMEGLHLSAFHRRVTGPLVADRLLALIGQEFDVREIAGPDAAADCFGVYVGRRWFTATFLGVRRDGLAGLDVAILQDRVLAHVAGGSESAPSVEITPAHTSLSELTDRCDDDGGALFTLPPPGLDVVTGLADRGELMPPKTTYFEPKPYAGIFLRS